MGYINRGPGIPCLPPTPMAAYDGGFGKVLPFAQWPNHAEAVRNLPNIKKLIAASDFMGVSNYARCAGRARARVRSRAGSVRVRVCAALPCVCCLVSAATPLRRH
jgi:hypothetical protein